MMISRVSPEQVDLIWPQVEHKVRRGIKAAHADVSPDYMRLAAKRGDAILWAVHEDDSIIAILAMRILVNRENGTKMLNVDLIAGERFSEWAGRMKELLEDYRDLIGASTIRATVRDGMTKWLRDYGWKRVNTTMELKHGR